MDTPTTETLADACKALLVDHAKKLGTNGVPHHTPVLIANDVTAHQFAYAMFKGGLTLKTDKDGVMVMTSRFDWQLEAGAFGPHKYRVVDDRTYDGAEDSKGISRVVGYGQTPQEAVEDFLEQVAG